VLSQLLGWSRWGGSQALSRKFSHKFWGQKFGQSVEIFFFSFLKCWESKSGPYNAKTCSITELRPQSKWKNPGVHVFSGDSRKASF
jgi:hypothetical protein